MRIDDRKVNGRVTIDPGDTVDSLTILLADEGPKWVTGFNPNASPIYASDSAVASVLKSALVTAQPLRFCVLNLALPGGGHVHPARAYAVTLDRTAITIDIDDILVGKVLRIAVATGAVTLENSK